MRVVLKTGKKPGPGEDDTRTEYDGRIKKGVETTFRDDQWARIRHGEKREKLFFALHVRDGYVSDVVQEYCEFKAAFASGETKQTLEEFLDDLRGKYLDDMPDDAEGVVFYLAQRDRRVYKGISNHVTHRQRYK
jgi:hypothetical protein